jgi:hypothetical protein
MTVQNLNPSWPERGVDLSARDAVITSSAIAPIALRESLPFAVADGYWRDVHGPLIAGLPGLSRYIQFHVRHHRGDGFPEIDGISQEIADVEQLDGIAELGWFSEEGRAEFDAAREEANVAQDDQHFLSRSTIQPAPRGRMATLLDTTTDPVPNGRVPYASIFLAFKKRHDASIEDFDTRIRGLAQFVADHPLALKSRYALLDTYRFEDWPGPNVFHAHEDDQYRAVIEIAFKNPLLREYVYRSGEFAAATEGLARSISAIHAFPLAEQITLVYNGRRTFAGIYGSTRARQIVEARASHLWTPEVPI